MHPPLFNERLKQPKKAKHAIFASMTPDCPRTGQPDFATLDLQYVPDARCIELKSLKLYIWSFRDVGAFHEAVTNRILDDLRRATAPRFMRLSAQFNVRGGIYTAITAEHRAAGWVPAPPVQLGE